MNMQEAKVLCWVRACKYNKDGFCTEPKRPYEVGCALTWYFTGQLPVEEEVRDEAKDKGI
jgi:hypothetical protein